jgi:hypothetical protein
MKRPLLCRTSAQGHEPSPALIDRFRRVLLRPVDKAAARPMPLGKSPAPKRSIRQVAARRLYGVGAQARHPSIAADAVRTPFTGAPESHLVIVELEDSPPG